MSADHVDETASACRAISPSTSFPTIDSNDGSALRTAGSKINEERAVRDHGILEILPLSAIVHCAAFLDHVSLTRLAFTCKRLLPVGLSDQLWRGICLKLTGSADDSCSRTRLYSWKRAAEYKKALTYGRVGRIVPPPRIIRYCLAVAVPEGDIYPEGTPPSPRAAPVAGGAGSFPATVSVAGGAGGETRWLMASRPVASSAPAGADVVVEAVCSRQGTASWSALGRA